MTEKTVACLSVRQPWASLIVHGIKPIENRTWSCAYRGLVVIHASKTWGREEEEARMKLLQDAIDRKDWRRVDVLGGERAKASRGGFVGVVRMVACVDETWFRLMGGRRYGFPSEWFTGPYGFQFTDARPFPFLVPYKGKQGLFRVPLAHMPQLEGM